MAGKPCFKGCGGKDRFIDLVGVGTGLLLLFLAVDGAGQTQGWAVPNSIRHNEYRRNEYRAMDAAPREYERNAPDAFEQSPREYNPQRADPNPPSPVPRNTGWSVRHHHVAR